MAKVLLVDDDVDVQKANKLAFEAKGHEVTLAYTGKDAIAELEKQKYDGMLLDVIMENWDAGFDTARELKKLNKSLPILMVTSINAFTDMSFGFPHDPEWNPVSKFVEKPLPPAKAVEELEALMAGE